MSFRKKFGAVALGVGSACGWAATNAVKAAFETIADKIGNGSLSDSKGNSYIARDYRDKASELEGKNGLWSSGFEEAKKLWNDED